MRVHVYFSILMHGILRVVSHIELNKEVYPPRLGEKAFGLPVF